MARAEANEPVDLVDVDDPRRCRQVAGRCERASHLDDQHYTSYIDGVWAWRIDSPELEVLAKNGELGLALTEALVARDRLAELVASLIDELEDEHGCTEVPVFRAALAQIATPVAPTSVGGTDG